MELISLTSETVLFNANYVSCLDRTFIEEIHEQIFHCHNRVQTRMIGV